MTDAPAPVSNTTDYEVLVVFAGSLKESARKAAIEKLQKELAALGKVAKSATWEQRPLAYKIKQETQGTYVITHLTGTTAAKIPEFENTLRLDPVIIRHLIVKTPKTYVWSEYTTEDLEHDYRKFNASIFAEDTATAKKSSAKSAAKPALRARPAAAPATPTPQPKPQTKEEKVKASKDIDKKLDSILDELDD